MSELRRVLDALDQAEKALGRARVLLGAEPDDAGEDELWARRMVSVLSEVDRRGGRIPGDDLLAVGESFGYRRRGMAGFYQDLLERDGDDAVLTEIGRHRLERLRSRHETLSPPPVSDSAFWQGARLLDPDDPFVVHVRKPKRGSGAAYDAQDAKRDLYKQGK